VAFERGAPTGINGVSMPILDLFDSLGTIAARTASAEGRDLREAPAAIVLHAAHRALRAFVASDDLNRLCGVIAASTRICAPWPLVHPGARGADAFVNTSTSASPASCG